MKKLVTAVIAVMVTFSSMAQGPAGNNSGKGKHHHKKDKFEKLNLSDEQKTEMKTIAASYRQQMKDAKYSAGTKESKSATRKALAHERRQKMLAILTPGQRKQADELKKEDAGFYKETRRADRFRDLTKQLNLSADQSSKVASLNNDFKSNMEKIKADNSLSGEVKKEEIKSALKKNKSDIKSLLTDEQKAQLKVNHKHHGGDNAVK